MIRRKGIILAGGKGTRLNPLTITVCKQLLPVYDKPLIYYPLSTLLSANIKDILIITNPNEDIFFKKLLGNGNQLGIKIDYKIQPNPGGIAQAYILAEEYLEGQSSVLILGDNIFHGEALNKKMMSASSKNNGGHIFGYSVSDPQRYGIVDFDSQMNVRSIVEKPKSPKTNYAIPGIYFLDSRAPEFAKSLRPSKRGELEITSLLKKYQIENNLTLDLLTDGFAWFDAGTFDSLLEASNYIRAITLRQGHSIGHPEFIAYKKGLIDSKKFKKFLSTSNFKFKDFL